MKNIKILMQFLLFGFCMISCKKYLEVLPDKKLVTIRNLEDLNSLLSAYYTINHIDPGVGEASSDNNYLSETAWQGIDEYERALYIWGAENVIRPYSYYGSGNCWSNSYNVVYLSNTVLTEIEHIKRSNINKHDWDKIKGEAYFLRGKSFLALASVFCLAFDSATADSDFGIPLRITPDFNELSIRSTLRETFEQIESDLLNAVPLLPKEPFHVMLPGKAAALGYLARLYHYMRKYDLALKYADSCLKLHNSLLDYNIDIQPSDSYPFKRFNKEVIYACRMAYPASLQYG
ncbi:MAG TPA: RagB/SusD family nutrient uptake outer membrane protein, partial [Candidatus Dojkabacteria bacterium]|nr:RagB/SusD family nutrient uptake outer membrane protein [Candidatus Dojkabacteria bacterium]